MTSPLIRRAGFPRLAAALATTSALAVLAPVAQAATKSLQYRCDYPVVTTAATTVDLDVDLPTAVPQKTTVGPFGLSFSATTDPSVPAEMRQLGAASLEGTATVTLVVGLPGGFDLEVPAEAQLPKVELPASGPLQLVGTGELPPLTFPTVGDATVSVASVELTVLPRDASGAPTRLGIPVPGPGGELPPFEAPVDCALDPAEQDPLLANLIVGLRPIDQVTEEHDYGVSGAAVLKSLAKGTVPLAGSAHLTLKYFPDAFDRSATVELGLQQSTARLVALGFLPVTAKVTLAPVGALTGSWRAGDLELVGKARVKLPQISVLGIQLAGGSSCQTRSASQLVVGGAFNSGTGGTLAGTFSISDLTGCGVLTGLVSPLTSGPGNTIALKLDAPAAPAA